MKHWTRQIRKLLLEYCGEPHKMAEIGVNDGVNASLLLGWFPTMTMILVDPYVAYAKATQAMCDARCNEMLKITAPYENRRIVMKMPSAEAAPLVKDGTLDAVFLDAWRDVVSAREDIAMWWPKVRRGGLVMLHDINKRDVQSAWHSWAEDKSIPDLQLVFGRLGYWVKP